MTGGRRFMKNTWLKYIGAVLFVALLSISLVACGSGSSDSDSESSVSDTSGSGDEGSSGGESVSELTVSGVAATGAPISGTVYLKDSNGTVLSTPINPDGSFTFDVTGLTPPFYLYAESSTTGERLYSIAMGPGIANINPLTNLAVAIAAGVNNPADVYNDPDSNPITQDDLDQAIEDILDILDPLLGAYGASGVNPLTDPFTANGEGLDGVFDDVDVDIDTVSGVVTFSENNTPLVIEVSGNGLNEREPEFWASLSIDVDTSSLETSSLNYSFKRIHLSSTSITEVLVTVDGVKVTGEGEVNGDQGYTFTAKISDSSPDTMGIEILTSDGDFYYEADPEAISIGDYSIAIR
jgi:hypothetical protein